jgi:ABC-type antimicrobial peptide transport system permease subunit
LLGVLAGLPPFIFENSIYLQAINYSAMYGWINGFLAVFFFGIGTWVGLFPLGLFGTMSGRINKIIRSHLQRQKLKKQLAEKKAVEEGLLAEQAEHENGKPREEIIHKKLPTEDEIRTLPSIWIELFSASFLIVLGIIGIILGVLKVSIFPGGV